MRRGKSGKKNIEESNMKTIQYILLILCCVSSSALAREIYVNNQAGDDRFNGAHPTSTDEAAGPLRTLGMALKIAQGGDKIVLAKNDQPYRESVTLWGSHNSGDVIQPFTIQGNGAVLDGSAPVPADAWEYYEGNVFRFRPPQKGYAQLFLDDRPAVRVVVNNSPLPAAITENSPFPMGEGLGVRAKAASLPKLESLQWCLRNGDLYFCVEKRKLPDAYRLSYAALPVGITLLHVDRVLIADLTIQGYQLDGVNAANSATDVRLSGLTLRGNGRSGLAVGGASSVELYAALLGNNGYAQLLTLPYSRAFIKNSNLVPNPAAPAWIDQGGETDLNGQKVKGGMEEIKAE